MKTLLTVFCFFTLFSAVAQSSVFKGCIYLEDSVTVSNGFVVFPLTKDTVFTDKSGIISFELTNPKYRLCYFTWMGLKSKIFRFTSIEAPVSIQKVFVPDTAFYRPFYEKHVCPVCLKSKYVIPIVYGYPSPKMFKRFKKKRIMLGGCIIQEYQPEFFCRRDEFEF